MNKIYQTSVLLFSGLIFTAALSAGEPVILGSLIKTAKDSNPEIIAAHARLNASKQATLKEKTWEKPKLTLEWWTIPEGTFDPSNAKEKMYGISQFIPFPGKLSLKGKTADSEAETLALEYKNTELMVLAELKSAYWRYWYINRSIEIYGQIAVIMKDFYKVAQSKYISGKTSQIEVLRAGLESDKILKETINLEAERQAIISQLNLLTGKDPDEVIDDPEETPLTYLNRTWNEIKTLTRSNNTDIGKASAAISKETAARKLAKLEYMPDFDVLYRKKTMNNESNGSDLMLGFTLPLWFWQQNSSVKETYYNLSAAGSDKRNLELSEITKAKETFTKLDAGKRLIELYKNSIIPKSEQTLKVAQSQISTGNLRFLEFLDISKAYLESELEYYNLLVQYQENIAKLEVITGTELSSGGSK